MTSLTKPLIYQPVPGSWTDAVSNAIDRLSNFAIFNSGSCTLSTTSASYVDIVNASTSWTKGGDSVSSDIGIYIGVDIYASVSSTGAVLGVGIGGTDFDVKNPAFISPASSVTPHNAWKRITGVAAGAYTPKLRAKRASGTGTLTIDTLCTVSFLIVEIPL